MQPDSPTVQLTGHGLRTTAFVSGTGPTVLCLHGFPDHARSFRHQMPALASAGYRAVAPLLRGYEPGSQPGPEPRHYHPLRVAADVVAWAAELGDEPVHIVGHDWGAIVSYLACALAPGRFRSQTTLAVASSQAMRVGARHIPGQIRNSWYVLFFQLRGLADVAARARDYALIERLWRDWSPGWSPPADELDAVKRNFDRPGVFRAALGYYRAMLNPWLDDSKRMQSMAGVTVRVPTLAVTGALDGCLDTRFHNYMDASLFPGGLQVERLDDAGHFLHQEDPGRVNELILGWLRRWDEAGDE